MSTTEIISYVCGESFTWGNRVYNPGRLYSADDTGVVANPQFFAPHGTPDDQLPRPGWDNLDATRAARDAERREQERIAFEAEAKQNPVKLVSPELVKCTSDYYGHFYGRPALIKRGSVIAADDDLVASNPELWKPC